MSEQNALVYVKRDADEGTPVNTPMLWMLIEYRTRNKLSTYEVVPAKDVCGGGGNRANSGLESMHTGKLIYVKKENGLVGATIVTISDDKQFLHNELKDLIELQKEDYEQHGHNKKRKRVTVPKQENMATSSQTQYARWNNITNETSAPSPSNAAMNKQSVIKSNPNVQNYPPMTFDQQTQTDFRANTEYISSDMRLNRIITTEENIMRDVHSMTEDNHEIKQQVADLRVEVAEIKSLLKDISEKFTQHGNVDGVHSTSTDFNRSSILNSTQTSTVFARTPSVNPPRILNLSHQSNYTPNTLNYNSISIEPVIDASNDSNFSYSNHSRMSLSASNQSIYQADTNHNDSGRLSAMKNEYNGNNSKNGDSFADEEGDPNEEVSLGPNNTTVPRSVLMNINWNSHTAATRRLLRAKFSREVLATHSLTGKPSPGMY